MHSNKENSNFDDLDMQNVELHRANSMPRPDFDFMEEKKETPVKQNVSKLQYAVSKAADLWSEIKNMKIEVIMFLYMFSYVMRSVSSTTMIMDKVCTVHLGYSIDICQNLSHHKDIKTAVEKLANNYHLGHALIQMVPASLLSCFIGTWSDKYGRKLPIIISLLGIIIDGLGSSICAVFLYSRVEYYFIPAIFTGISGGFIGVLTVIYSYAADTTTFSKRTMKYAIMEMTFGLSMPAGQLVGGWLYKFSGYSYVFLISTGGHILALAWVMFVIVETRGLDNRDNWRVKWRNFWSLAEVNESFKATIKKRPNRGREQILWLMVAMSFAVLSMASTMGISFLYVHHQYDWDNTKYSTVSAVFSIIGTITMLISVPLFKRFRFGDPTLGLVGSASSVLKNITMGLANSKEIYVIANFTGLLSGLSTLAGRSRISKVCSKTDIGKVFSFLTTAEVILPILSTAVVSQVFNATLDIYPGLIYLIMGFLLLVPFGIFIWLSRLPVVNYEEIYNNPGLEYDEEKPTDKQLKIIEKY